MLFRINNRLIKLFYSFSVYVNGRLSLLLGKTYHRKVKSANYQPLPWINLQTSRRFIGSDDRWNKIKPELNTVGSFLDIGSNVGYFVLSAAEQGNLSWGIDSDLKSNLIASYVAHRAKINNAHFFSMKITPDNINSLPKFDYILLLSVFHHWCKDFGFTEAKKMLKVLSDKCGKKLFFETGQEEMSSYYNLPKMEDPLSFLRSLLQEVSRKQVTVLGDFPVFVNKGTKNAQRYLFMIE